MIEEALWKTAALVAAVFLLIIAPLMASYERMDDIAYVHVMAETEAFVDGMLEKGQLTDDMWRIYKKKLGATGLLFDVELAHYRKQPLENGDIWMEGTYNVDILDALGSDGVFTMMTGEYIYITVKNRKATKAEQIKGVLLVRGGRAGTIFYRDGGMVRHDGN